MYLVEKVVAVEQKKCHWHGFIANIAGCLCCCCCYWYCCYCSIHCHLLHDVAAINPYNCHFRIYTLILCFQLCAAFALPLPGRLWLPLAWDAASVARCCEEKLLRNQRRSVVATICKFAKHVLFVGICTSKCVCECEF